ncbi:MAG: hypothetical protein M3304_01480 [Actinomycetota bacterium]|nr:hypothetical protein [Actinomycetota bacterium]
MREPTATLVPGPPRLPELHARESPQKNFLCGAFWGALVLQAAGIEEVEEGPVDQDLVAVLSGTSLPTGDPATFVPAGASPRRDYRLHIPTATDVERSGTATSALARVIEDLSSKALAVVPVAGPWTGDTVLDLVEAAGSTAPASVLVANLRSGALWGSRPPAATLLAHLAGASVEPPPPDWDVGHFVTIVGSLTGARRALVLVRDTYPTLGWGGYHLQPAEALAAALSRGDGREGGVLCVCEGEEAQVLRSRLEDAAYELRHWDNGTPDPLAERAPAYGARTAFATSPKSETGR